jgi:hypothetical protein
MKQLELIRLEKTEEGVLGVLLIENRIFCYTLEHPTLLVKEGTYPLIFEFSNKFQRMLYELKETGERTECKFHVGNTMKDTTGCPLLGRYVGKLAGKRAVLSSAETVDRFHHKMKGEDANLSITDLSGI